MRSGGQVTTPAKDGLAKRLHHNIAAVYNDQRDHARALENHLKALEIHRATLGDQHPRIATDYNGLAIVYPDQGAHAKAFEASSLCLSALGITSKADE
jgi:hypothetical protein